MKKVWVVVKDMKGGGSEVIGVFEDLKEAMFISSDINTVRTNDIEEVYLQEHELKKVSPENNLMNLKEMSEWIKEEENK